MGDFGIGMRLKTSDGKPVVPLNSMFLGVKYANFHWNFRNINVGAIHGEDLMEVSDQCLYVDVEKVSDDEFQVLICRVDPKIGIGPDPGYFLELIITVVGHREGPKRKFMDFRKHYVRHVYKFSEMDFDRRESTIWTIQCVVYMHEITFLCNRNMTVQNSLRKIPDEKGSFSENIPDMQFLLGRESLNDIFSGRQDYQFAYYKKGYVERTLVYAKEIKAKMTDKNFHSASSQEEYLRYIHNKEEILSKTNIIDMYKDSYTFGLCYLVKECREFMLRNMMDLEYLVNVLANAVDVADFEVIPKAISVFLSRLDVLDSEAWKKLLVTEYPKARCILHFAERQLTLGVNRILARQEKMYEQSVPKGKLCVPVGKLDKRAAEAERVGKECTGTKSIEESAAEKEQALKTDF